MTAEIEFTCKFCHAVLLAPREEEGEIALCPCGKYVRVPAERFIEKLRLWSQEYAYERWKYNQMANFGFNNARMDTIRAVLCIVFMFLLYIGLDVMMKAGNEPLGPRMGYDMTASTPVMVDNPDGTITVEKVPVFTSTKGYTDREANSTVWIVFAVASFMLFGCIYGSSRE